MAAQRAHPVQQLPALLLVDQRNQLEADLEGQLFEAQQSRQIRALRLLRPSSSRPRRLGRGRERLGPRSDAAPPRRALRPRPETPASGKPGIRHMAAETRLAR